MTFIEMLTLEQQPFNLILAEAPEAEYKSIRKYLVRLTFIRAMIREAARISAEQGSKVMLKHAEAENQRGAKERVKIARLAKITTLQGTDIEQGMPDWAKRLESTIHGSLAEMKKRQGELQLQQEKLEEQNHAILARLDTAMAAMASRGSTRLGGVMYTPTGRLPSKIERASTVATKSNIFDGQAAANQDSTRSTEGCA